VYRPSLRFASCLPSRRIAIQAVPLLPVHLLHFTVKVAGGDCHPVDRPNGHMVVRLQFLSCGTWDHLQPEPRDRSSGTNGDSPMAHALSITPLPMRSGVGLDWQFHPNEGTKCNGCSVISLTFKWLRHDDTQPLCTRECHMGWQ